MIRKAFVREDAVAILGILIGRIELEDSLLWHYDVSVGYRLARTYFLTPSGSGLSQSRVRSISGVSESGRVLDSMPFFELCVFYKAVCFLAKLRDVRRVEVCWKAGSLRETCWKAPTVGSVKINTDTVLNGGRMVSGIGVSLIVKALAVLAGMRLTFELDLAPLVEADALAIMNLISAQMVPASDVGIIIHDILHLVSSRFVSFNFVPRLANEMAHGLAKLALDYEKHLL
ncbi:hypothetical protein QYF36_023609 [Acer negundo]|nr:hypothetical protein QYF36_023609 [Acer negundo]